MNSLRDVTIEEFVKVLKLELKQLTEDMIMEFLMGEKNQYMDKTLRSKTKNQKIPFDQGKRKSLVQSKDWTENRFKRIVGDKAQDGDYQQFVKTTKEFWEKYIGTLRASENDSEFIKSLVSYIWLRTPFPEDAFVWTPIDNGDYISWVEKETEIKEKVSLNTLTFITGNAATGKRKLVNNYLYESEILNYVFAEVVPNSFGEKVEVEYISSGKKEVQLLDFLKQCEWRRKNDYIILTWSYFTKDEIKPFLHWVQNNDIKAIVITREKKIPDGYEKVDLDKWPEDLLMKISNNKLKSEASKEEYITFFETLCYNPFLVEVFSKYLNKGDESISSFCKNAKIEGETEQLALSKGSKVHFSYRVDKIDKNKGNNALPIATALMRCLLPCSDEDIRTLCNLVVWTRTPIDKEFVIKMGGFEEETINSLIAKQYLIYTEENEIQMYPIFVWSVDAIEVEFTTKSSDEKSTEMKALFDKREILFNENGVKSGLTLLNSMIGSEKCSTSYIRYFYQVIENIICRYHRVYSVNTNLTDKSKTQYYEQWTKFLEKAMFQIQVMSPSKQAKRIHKKIYAIYKKNIRTTNERVEQSLLKNWEEFIYLVMNGCLKDEDIYKIYSELPSRMDVTMLYPVLDVFILREIAELSLEFAKPIEDRNIEPKNKYLLYMLKEYFDRRIFAEDDEWCDMYCVIHYYLLSIYYDRKYIKDARQAASNVYQSCKDILGNEIWIRVQLYFLFFELLVDTEQYDAVFLCMKYKHLILNLAQNFYTKSYSACTTSTAIITLMLARAWVPVELMDGKINELLEQFEVGRYDLFQKLADVNKYQYQIGDKQYQKLLQVLRNSTEGIYNVLSKSYVFKKNK